MIERIRLRNFTAFSDITLNLSKQINVIIGENGTGKSHLLKAAYGLCTGAPLFKKNPQTTKSEFEDALTDTILRLYLPIEDKLGKLHHQGAADQASLSAQFAGGQKINAKFHNNSKLISVIDRPNVNPILNEAVFIPTKEVLSFMKGFTSLYDKYELSFDQTYQDICKLLDLPEVRLEILHPKSKWAMDEISKICGGHFVFYGGGKVTFKTENAEYSANTMAEGFRKVGILSRLLETGAIRPGISGPLIWDEPESNLNPKLLQKLVQILLDLSHNGQQVILATHDYVLLKWFDLLLDKSKHHVRYHCLYRDENNGRITVNTTDDYIKIKPNPIDEAFGYLIDQEIENDMGILGK